MAQLTPSVYKSKAGFTFLTFQWTGQALNTIPGWAAGNSTHVSGGVLHLSTRNGTFLVKPNDWVVQEPDGIPNVVTNAVFQSQFTPGP